MAIYWRLKSVPELEGLERVMQVDVWAQVMKQLKKRGWAWWMLASGTPEIMLCVFGVLTVWDRYFDGMDRLGRRVHEVLLSVKERGVGVLFTDDAGEIMSIKMICFGMIGLGMLLCFLVSFVLLRPIRVAVSRRHIREFLAAG